jgi:hypothetical protein
MTARNNVPDRFKLILQFFVFSLGGALLLLLLLMFSGFFAHFHNANFGKVLVILFAISVALNSWRFVSQWKSLRKKEEAGEIPDYSNPQNIKPFQLIIICVEAPLVLVGYVLYELYSKVAGQVCLSVAIVIAVLEILYLKLCNKTSKYPTRPVER